MEADHRPRTDRLDADRRDADRLDSGPVDVAIVGGGLAGLTAATVAARAGARTLVVDAAPLGGRARTDVRDGVSLNLGPHALYLRGAGVRTLAGLGIEPAGGRPQASGPAWLDGRPGALPTTTTSVLTTKLLSGPSRLRFARFMSGLDRLDTSEHQHRSVDDLVDALANRDDLRALLHGLIRLSTYANAPTEMSAGAALDQLRLAMGGVRYLDGGWGTIVEALAGAARAAGAAVHPGVRVDALTTTAGGWRLATSAGDVGARSVVLAGLSPEAVERLADLAPGSMRDLAGPTARAACLDLVVDGTPPESFALDLDQALYYSVHSAAARLTPDGTSLASLAKYRRTDESGDPHADRIVMTEFARRLGVGEARDARYLHDMVVANGIPLARRGGLPGRPDVDELASAFDRPGLLVAGDWVGSDGLLADAAIASGAAAANAAVRSPDRAVA